MCNWPSAIGSELRRTADYCFVRVKVPPEIGFPHELVAEYVPAIVELVTPLAVTEKVVMQGGSSVPVTVIVRFSVVPENVPATVPLSPMTPVVELVAPVPETVDPDWERFRVRRPLPVLSDAGPWYTPETVSGAVGESLFEQAKRLVERSRMSTGEKLRFIVFLDWAVAYCGGCRS